MNYSKAALVTALIALAVGSVLYVQADEADSAKTIDAGAYGTLQEAFDAVPASGGLIRVPPGRYELTEPLVLSREDTRVEGAGAATHIINKNQKQ